MRIAHRHKLGNFVVDIILEGSGNPAEEHDIVGVTFKNSKGDFLQGCGEIDEEVGVVKEMEIIKDR